MCWCRSVEKSHEKKIIIIVKNKDRSTRDLENEVFYRGQNTYCTPYIRSRDPILVTIIIYFPCFFSPSVLVL